MNQWLLVVNSFPTGNSGSPIVKVKTATHLVNEETYFFHIDWLRKTAGSIYRHKREGPYDHCDAIKTLVSMCAFSVAAARL